MGAVWRRRWSSLRSPWSYGSSTSAGRSSQRVRSLAAVRMEAKELGKRLQRRPEYERRQACKYIRKAAAEEALDLYGQLFPPMSKAASRVSSDQSRLRVRYCRAA